LDSQTLVANVIDQFSNQLFW